MLEFWQILGYFGIFGVLGVFGGVFGLQFGVWTMIRVYWPFNCPADQSRSIAIDWMVN
jgi:hypothetical protein